MIAQNKNWKIFLMVGFIGQVIKIEGANYVCLAKDVGKDNLVYYPLFKNLEQLRRFCPVNCFIFGFYDGVKTS
jgi:hypothetical protein